MSSPSTRRSTVTAAVLLALAASGGAWADGGTERWESTYREGEPAYSTDVVTSPDGATVFVTGATDTTNKNSHVATIAYDAATGTARWSAEFPGRSDPEAALGRLVAISPDGKTLFVSANTFCRGSCAGKPFDGQAVVAYDAKDGQRLWVARYDSGGGGAYDISVDPAGSRVFVGGSSDGGLSSVVLAYDAATGDEVWKLERPSGLSEGMTMGLSPDGATVYVADPAPPATPVGPPCFSLGGGYRTVALDSVDGSPIWSSTFTNAGQSCGVPTDLVAGPDGQTIFLTGKDRADEGNYGSQTVALDASSGDVVWDVDDPRILTTGGDSKVSLGVDPDGSKVVVFGDRCEKPAFGCDTPIGSTIAYDADSGASVWASTYSGGGQLFATDLQVAPDGSSVYVTGQENMPCFDDCQIFARTDAPLVAYDLDTGIERWASVKPDSYNQALAVSPDGRSIFTAGASTGSTDSQRSLGSLAHRAACSGVCGYSTLRANTGPGRGKREDDAVAVTYDGWKGYFDSRASGGSYRASHDRGDTVEFTTPGAASITWLTQQGPNRGKAKLVIDGRPKGVVDLYSATASARAVTVKGLKKIPHTIKIKVLGRKRAGSSGTSVAVDGFAYNAADGISQESSPAVRFNAWNGSSTKNGSVRTSSSRSSQASLEFTGRRVTWVTVTGPAYGRARVVIDGKARIVDLFSAKQGRARFTFKGLSTGDHRITVKPLGSKNPRSRGTAVVVDAFVV